MWDTRQRDAAYRQLVFPESDPKKWDKSRHQRATKQHSTSQVWAWPDSEQIQRCHLLNKVSHGFRISKINSKVFCVYCSVKQNKSKHRTHLPGKIKQQTGLKPFLGNSQFGRRWFMAPQCPPNFQVVTTVPSKTEAILVSSRKFYKFSAHC